MSKKHPVMSHDPLADLSEPQVTSAEPAVSPGAEGAEDQPVELPSSLTIADVGELHSTLVPKLQRVAPLFLDGKHVEVVDGAGLQLLASLVKTALEKGIEIRWQGASDGLLRAASQFGIAGRLGMSGDQKPAL